MQVVWEANTADFAKRKRAARACTVCQKRKKRCHHTFSNDSPAENSSRDDQADLDAILPRLTHQDPIRFVGDLNPESILTDLSTRSKGVARENQFGTWVRTNHEPEIGENEAARNFPVQDKTTYPVERYAKVERSRRFLSTEEKAYLHSTGAFRVLPRETQDVLVTSYFSYIDSLLPIIDGSRLLKAYAAGTASIFLIQAICLVTCKCKDAAPFLRLTEDGPLMDPLPFARALYTGLDTAIKSDLECDRLTKVQILTLMSLHNDGPTGLEESSLHLGQAIHNAHSAGLHVLTSNRRTDDEASYTWWSLWVLDKFNASLGGRAIQIADRDMGLPRPEVYPDTHFRSQSLAMWLGLASLLDDVICYYRPTSDPESTGWEAEFPSFESLAFGLNIPDSGHRICLELSYNIIAILTCRSGGPSTASYRRRVEAADNIQRLMSTSENADHVPPLPLVPYAVSLSLTVAYRLLRDSSPTTDIEKAKRDLADRCDILESLRSRWWSADAMAKLGRKALASLNLGQDGFRGNGDAVAGMMDVEVAVCKFGPFDGRRAVNGDTLSMDGTGDILLDGQGSNALDVLSTAAASLNDVSSLSTYPPPDELGLSMPPYTGNLDATAGVTTVDQFHDLDMLFGDFFDLGMPTLFDDPLFEAAAWRDFV